MASPREEQDGIEKKEKETVNLPTDENSSNNHKETGSSPLSSELSDLEDTAMDNIKPKQEQGAGEDSEAETERLDDQAASPPPLKQPAHVSSPPTKVTTTAADSLQAQQQGPEEESVSRKRKFDHVEPGSENRNADSNKQPRNDDDNGTTELQNGRSDEQQQEQQQQQQQQGTQKSEMETETRDEDDEAHEEEEGEDEEEEEEEAEDEDEGDEDEEDEEIDEESKNKAREAKNKEAEEAAKIRKEALASLTDIEVEFAKLRDKLHEDKLARFKVEANMCNGGTHPELVRIYRQFRGMCGEKIGIIEANRKYQRQCILNQTRAIRDRIHQQFFKERGETRQKLMTQIGDELYKLTRERRLIDNIVPDYAYRVPRSRHIQIKNANAHNYEVGLLSAISKYIGFPAAPQIQPASRDEVHNDLQAMGLE